MAKKVDENIRKQLEKPQVWFYKYFPKRIQNVGEDAVKARNLIWAFKDARDDAHEEVARLTAAHLTKAYGKQVKDMVFVCVPASSQVKNESRYRIFCERVSELSGIGNGYSYINVSGERLSVHENRNKEKELREVSTLRFDIDQIKGKTVCVFDDVITTGQSFALFANKLEEYGAKVVGGVFLARTHYRYL